MLLTDRPGRRLSYGDADTQSEIKFMPNISGDTGSNTTFLWALNCLQFCLRNHKLCQSSQNFCLPRRVLDLSASSPYSNDRVIKLYETRKEEVPYVCLSHCWGEYQPLRTIKSTLEEYKRGIAWPLFPNMFQDAMIFVQKLGIRYMWIDSLCIIQDDREDWRTESKKMCSIYENSILTIAATKSKSSTGGCFSIAPPEYCGFKVDEIATNNKSWDIFVRNQLPHYEFSREGSFGPEPWPLLKRGWALQERLLAPRVLHFGEFELLWECIEDTSCECGDKYFSQNLRKMQHKRMILEASFPQIVKSWCLLVEELSSLEFTFASDRLPALLGLATQYSKYREDKYIAGIWEGSLLSDIL
jgi:hypothetical protein